MKITIVTVSTTAIRELIDAAKIINNNHPGILDLQLHYAGRDLKPGNEETMKQDIIESDAVLVDLMGSPSDLVADVYSSLEKCTGQIIPYGNTGRAYMRLGDLTPDSMKMGDGAKPPSPEMMRKMAGMAETVGKMMPAGKMRDMRNLSQISKYFRIAEGRQLENMLYLILRDYGGCKELPKPEPAFEAPVISICDPSTRSFFDNYDDYKARYGFDENKPTIGLLFYSHTYPDDTSQCVAAIIEKLRKTANILPVGFGGTSAENFQQLREWMMKAAGKPVDMVLNFMSFRLGAGPMGGDAEGAINILKEVNAPYFHPFFMTRRRVLEWEESATGLNSSEFMISIMLPELDGSTEAIPVGAMTEPVTESTTGIELKTLTLIEERADTLVDRVNNYLKLRSKPEKEKKVAIIGYNYPPGEDNIFGGSFLDTFESISNIVKHLGEEGYTVEPLSAEDLMEQFTAGRIVNSGRYAIDESALLHYAVDDYLSEIESMPEKDELIRQWGMPPGTVMAGESGDFLIPGMITGNIFIGLQPSRGIHENTDKAYHDKELMPHHQYIAFYRWLRNVFEADAIIHVGTHGTIEFLKGKECGMSARCFPDRLVSDVPHMYLYYTGNPSEAMIAKRRSHANLIGYQPPEYIQADLYGEFTRLSAMIDEYRESLRISPARSDSVLETIREKAKELNLPEDMEELERELYRMNRSLIPKGLHVFGTGYNEDEAFSYVKCLLRYERDGIKSLRRIAAEIEHLDYDQALESGGKAALCVIDTRFEALFELFRSGEKISDIPSSIKKDVSATFDYARSVMKSCRENAEMRGLMKTLNGEFNPARLAGDIFRNPEVLPSGYNLYQFDPRFVPSKTASDRGWQIAEATLEQYRRENDGLLPDSTAVILWGLETSRTQGETVAQVLSYLGVRVARSMNVWEPSFEIIPLEELGRKRIDVVINICGFFRDMFPNIVDALNKLFEELADLDEPDEMNCFKANTKRLYRVLKDQGFEEDEARELAHSRIFGPDEAQYGTGITGIIETKNWEKEEQIGEEFVRKLRYVYSKNYRARDVEGLLNQNLSTVDIVSQIRSNHEYEITDLDHYYEFFGGLAKSVEMASGRKAKMYITDTTGEKIIAEGVDKAIGRGIRTRVLNPKWIDGMLEHKYHGVQKIAERFENVMGLAATTNAVNQWVYDDLHSKYIDDEEMRERLKENNPHAYLSIVEQMIEYHQRGYWDASEEQIEKLTQVYLELEGDIEDLL